jgi:hypothetical protein
VLLEEMGDRSILITEHRYTPKYNYGKDSGVYCVQFVTFKNNEDGLRALHWWRDRCIEWCYARYEDGKFGDQKYLDDWTTRFKGVHVLQHLGGGVAPWNIQQYDLIAGKNDTWTIVDKKTKEKCPLVFYHFHHVKFFDDNTVNLSGIYDLDFQSKFSLYTDYVKRIDRVNKRLKEEVGFVAPLSKQEDKKPSLYEVLRMIYKRNYRAFRLYNDLKMEELLKA